MHVWYAYCRTQATAAERLQYWVHLMCNAFQSMLLKAQSLAGSDGIVVAAGSLYLMGELRSVLKLPWR